MTKSALWWNISDCNYTCVIILSLIESCWENFFFLVTVNNEQLFPLFISTYLLGVVPRVFFISCMNFEINWWITLGSRHYNVCLSNLRCAVMSCSSDIKYQSDIPTTFAGSSVRTSVAVQCVPMFWDVKTCFLKVYVIYFLKAKVWRTDEKREFINI